MSEKKKAYTTPTLTVHGTVEQVTRKAVGKSPGAGDGAQQWPYGKIPSGEDAMGAHSRS
jgi:hypothetical protein